MNINRNRGQAIVEMALVLPIFLIVFIGIFDFGRGLHCWSSLNYQCVETARFASKRIHPLIGRNVFSANTHPSLIDVKDYFETKSKRSPMMPEEDFNPTVYAGVGDDAKEVSISASYNLSLYTPILGGLVGGESKDGAITIRATATERKE